MKIQSSKFKVQNLFLVIFLGILLFPLIISAGSYKADGTTVYYRGFVPCGVGVCLNADFDASGACPGTNATPACQLCHLFVMADGIVDFLLVYFLFPIAILMIVIAGVLYVGSVFEILPGGFETLSKAKGILFSVALGLIIIFAAFILVGFFLKFIELADWTTNIYKNWWTSGFFEVKCLIKL